MPTTTNAEDGAVITLDGTLRDERGPVVTFGDEATICAWVQRRDGGAADGLRRKLDTGSHLMQADRPE